MAQHVYVIRNAKPLRKGATDFWHVNAELAEREERRVMFVVKYFEERNIIPSLYHYSLLARSWQTCDMLRTLMMSPPETLDLNVEYGPENPEVWNEQFELWKKQQADPGNPPTLNSGQIMKLWSKLAKADGERTLRAIQKTAAVIKDGESAVAISHNPLIRLAQTLYLGQNKIKGPDLKYCQMIRFSFEGSLLCGTQEILLDTKIPGDE